MRPPPFDSTLISTMFGSWWSKMRSTGDGAPADKKSTKKKMAKIIEAAAIAVVDVVKRFADVLDPVVLTVEVSVLFHLTLS